MGTFLTLLKCLNERICGIMRPLVDIPPSADRERLEMLLIGLMRSGSTWQAAEWSARRALVYEIVDEACQALVETFYGTWHYEEISSLARFVIRVAGNRV